MHVTAPPDIDRTSSPTRRQPPGRPGFHRRAFALLVQYDGTPYKGWQPHPHLPTVAGVLRAALHRAGIGATPFGASRTDAGVHARAQVASFTTREPLDERALRDALNADLPSTLRVLALREADASFHAHWSSIGKVYRYRISFCGEVRAWRLPTARFPFTSLPNDRLDRAVELLRAAPDVGALALSGEHGPTLRRLDRIEVLEKGPRGAVLELQAAGFGKYLVRHLVAAAVGYAVGAYEEADIARILARQAPRPPRADADGLTLFRVLYPADVDPFPDLSALAHDA